MSGERRATHAGSWYEANPTKLRAQLTQWLDDVPKPLEGVGDLPAHNGRLIITPHAGYSYSGPCAAYSYASLDLTSCQRIFLLGPSHHARLSGCGLSPFETYATPLGPIDLDLETMKQLEQTNGAWFRTLPGSVDEAEHSLEMQLPYIRLLIDKWFSGNDKPKPKLIPIIVPSVRNSFERDLGGVLADYLADPHTVFVISSDFCHWGIRFAYTYYLPKLSSEPPFPDAIDLRRGQRIVGEAPTIHESISCVDHVCMDAVASGQAQTFWDVLKETGNTVCGRHPIGVAMCTVEKLKEKGVINDTGGAFHFMKYDRSDDRITKVEESSVSYCAAVACLGISQQE
ncbi:MAG: hypothetical protein M1834_003545 [Cirrosporium novae-zelandiae]|nr:MAG: hypothetical protein M1834_003545 [Cirrosporium novae-zelandiae]